MAHPYLRFRIRLARHAVAQLLARLRSAGEIILLALGPALLGLLACAALPPMFFSSYPAPEALALLAAHGVLMSLPILLLRPRILPAAVTAWLAPLPVPPRLLLGASAHVAALLLAPLALAYLSSLAIWLLQHARPDWLQPVRAAAATLFSLLLTWACAAWLLYRGALPPPGAPLRTGGIEAAPYVARPRHASWAFLWRHLFWLPLWRAGSLAGLRQAALLCATMIAFGIWMSGALLPRAGGAIVASVLLVLLVHDADDALRTQLARLRVAAAGLPLAPGSLGWRAQATLLATLALPLLAISIAGLAARAWQPLAGRVYLALAWLLAPLLVSTPPFTARGRVALVAFFMLVLCATGSQIWT